MNLEIFADSQLIESLGWALVHSIWQIALAAFVLFLLLRIFHEASGNFRYLLSVLVLIVCVVLPVITFFQFAGNSKTNSFSLENSAPNYTKKISQNPRRSENFFIDTNSEEKIVEGSNEKNLLVNLQNSLNEKFANLMPTIVAVWFFGVLLFAVRLGGGFWQLHRYKTREILAADDEWQKKFFALCDKLEIRRTVKFFKSNLLETPIVSGWLKPVVLVPASLFVQMNPRELEMLIVHELIHVRRSDALVNFAQSAIEVLFFYHPCVWWISDIIRREREFAADERVTEILENSKIVYANALANLEEIRLQRTIQNLPPVATAANGGNLVQRIAKILKKKTEIKRAASLWSALSALVIISAVVLGIFSFNRTALVNAQPKTANKKIAVGFVSIPPVDRTANAPKDSDETARLLIEKLKSHRVPAVGFLTGGSISDGEKFYPVRANIARLWRDAGFEIGIGNFKHVWFYETPYQEYAAGVEKNEQVAKKLLAEKNLSLKYFSYPYLNTGKNADERNRFEAWLKARGITPVKYTIDNQEWMYSYAYDMARNDNDLNTMKEIQTEFLGYMSKMFDHFERYSQEMFGRDINQTMVLTPSRLVADSADELFGMIEKRGYAFVSMDEAQRDEAYNTPESFYGKSGISWFERWQMAKGKKLLDEPDVDVNVEKIWNENKSRNK